MKKLKLNRGYAIVDDNIFNIVSKYRWYVNAVNNNTCNYVVRNERINAFKNNKVLLHRFVYQYYHGELKPGVRLRFVNGNSLDCRHENITLKKKTATK